MKWEHVRTACSKIKAFEAKSRLHYSNLWQRRHTLRRYLGTLSISHHPVSRQRLTASSNMLRFTIDHGEDYANTASANQHRVWNLPISLYIVFFAKRNIETKTINLDWVQMHPEGLLASEGSCSACQRVGQANYVTKKGRRASLQSNTQLYPCP